MFSDDDLKRLKQMKRFKGTELNNRGLQALLARLEAAEAVCVQMDYFFRHGIINRDCESDQYDAWLRSKGEKA